MKTIFAVSVALVIAAGCSDDSESKSPDRKYDTPLTGTAAGQVIEDMAGATTVKAGRKTQEAIKKIAAQEKQNLDEVLEK